MHTTDRTTLAQFLIEETRDSPPEWADLVGLLLDVAQACKVIARLTALGQLGNVHGYTGDVNPQGETQARLDQLSHNAFVRACELTGHVAGLASEEEEEVIPVRHPRSRGSFLLAFDPLDGSSNIDTNGTVGSLFSILPYDGNGRDAVEADFMRPGREQVAAGYALYGPSTMFVLSIGNGVHGFTLDPLFGDFILTHPNMRVPDQTNTFAINASNHRFWELPVRAYVDELLAGRTGPRARDYNMRWIAALVADCHRILLQGGIYLYPRDARDPSRAGRLRLLYEAAPIAFLMEQAGGRCIAGETEILDVVPETLHQRIPLFFGSREEVDRVEALHRSGPPGQENPLFHSRSLFRS
ncbi:class 1 fructose-bisphosphatase [Phaeovibrio sulfidiphilus]|uniref:Fructose-1,6-bisphosphatase class 1 n=1 Tax=Phaeovibrio sulfidiphilus TaxID=1220600 RepID=A0A8J7CD63_9PROT|nr:class 1 fructose-bisphosphatase [Phaeovibrio sulfidiphilus]MBE1236754.1 class 1 fructose-bisphosphatase [Phaeovibrio sulfidiphilus]